VYFVVLNIVREVRVACSQAVRGDSPGYKIHPKIIPKIVFFKKCVIRNGMIRITNFIKKPFPGIIFLCLLLLSSCSDTTNSSEKLEGGSAFVPESPVWYVSQSGSNANNGSGANAPLTSLANALSLIKAAYKSGAWKAGKSAVIVISGTISGIGTSNGLIDISGPIAYPPIILRGDPVRGGILDAGGKKRVLYINNGNTVTIDTGLTLTGGDALKGGAVFVYDHSRFVMNGGTITGNIADNGGAISVDYYSSVEISGGIISGNKIRQQGNGAGIYVDYESAVTMTDGKIENNGDADTKFGGGVFINGHGTFIQQGGEISGNTANDQGGGVKAGPFGIFEHTGGSITGNTAKSGGGVYAATALSGKYTHTGGTVGSNTPDDVVQ
jgi:hypothetical protein